MADHVDEWAANGRRNISWQINWDYCMKLSEKKNPVDRFSVRGSQFERLLVEFSGACAGCGETPYIKLMTQLFGDRMYIANATGCALGWRAR